MNIRKGNHRRRGRIKEKEEIEQGESGVLVHGDKVAGLDELAVGDAVALTELPKI